MTLSAYLLAEMHAPTANANHLVRCVIDNENAGRLLIRIQPLSTPGSTLWYEVVGNTLTPTEDPENW